MASSENKGNAGQTARYVARMAKRMRTSKGWSQEHLGKLMGFSGAAVSAMETLAQPVSDGMLIKLEEHLGGGTGIFEEARPYVRMEKFPELFQDFALLEQKALTLSAYAVMVVHGLFQTQAYAKALIGGGYPLLPSLRVNELVEARMERKLLLDRTPTALVELIVDEAVLRRTIGSQDIMREQLLHLSESGRRRNVTLQVLPLTCGLEGEHAGDRGGMTLVETLDHDRLIYLEAQDESLLISDAAKVSTYFQRYAKIRAQALSPSESLILIKQLAGEQR
jgi:transcriptional regulator with XRE-family HTH domain